MEKEKGQQATIQMKNIGFFSFSRLIYNNMSVKKDSEKVDGGWRSGRNIKV